MKCCLRLLVFHHLLLHLLLLLKNNRLKKNSPKSRVKSLTSFTIHSASKDSLQSTLIPTSRDFQLSAKMKLILQISNRRLASKMWDSSIMNSSTSNLMVVIWNSRLRWLNGGTLILRQLASHHSISFSTKVRENPVIQTTTGLITPWMVSTST